MADQSADRRMTVEIWSDVVCPWCYIGKRRFEEALAMFVARDQVDVIFRSFQLDPDAPAWEPRPIVEVLAGKYRSSLEQAQEMLYRTTATAARHGLEFDFAKIRGANTFNAHRLLHLAADYGKQGEMKERLMNGYFTGGAPIGDTETLVQLATEVGLDEADARKVLENDDYSEEVLIEQRTAQELGITGVPFFVIDRKYGVSGAQSSDILIDVLQEAWAGESL